MAAPTLQQHPLVAGFDEFASQLPDEPGALKLSRRLAFERFAELGIPTRRLEQWRHTDLGRLNQVAFIPARAPGRVTPEDIDLFHIPGARELVFVDGFYAPELSNPGEVGEKLWLGSLAARLAEKPEAVLRYLDDENAVVGDPVFASLNRAYWQDGAFVNLYSETVLEEPIHLLHIATAQAGPTANFPRNLVYLHLGSQATLIETYAATGGTQRFTCPLSEIVFSGNAGLDHYRIERESPDTIHIATTRAHLGDHARLRSLVLASGAGLQRHDIYAALLAPGGEAQLHGLYLTSGTQHVDHHLWVRHAKPHTASRQVFKGVLAGRSRGVFNGLIHVDAGAVRTDAKQTNRNLLLSDAAIVHTNPQLEIFEGDVRCTHGSTVGQLDDDALFYLRARGLGEQEARNLLAYAFAADLLDDVRVRSVRSVLEKFLSDWLAAQGDGHHDGNDPDHPENPDRGVL